MQMSMRFVVILTLAGLLSACGTLPPSDVSLPPETPPELTQPSERSVAAIRRSPFTEPPGELFAAVTQATIATTMRSRLDGDGPSVTFVQSGPQAPDDEAGRA